MSYAGQQIEYAIVSKDSVNELEFLRTYGKLTDIDIVLDTFRYFIKEHFLSDIFYFPEGHCVLAEFEKGTNKIIRRNDISEKVVKEKLFKIDFFEIVTYEDKEYEMKMYSVNVAAKENDARIFAQNFEIELKKHVKKLKFVISCLN